MNEAVVNCLRLFSHAAACPFLLAPAKACRMVAVFFGGGGERQMLPAQKKYLSSQRKRKSASRRRRNRFLRRRCCSRFCGTVIFKISGGRNWAKVFLHGSKKS